jgi:Anti-sigma-K factor rskA
MTDFHDLIDTDDLDHPEEERLRRIHDLLVDVGPPPELPPALQRPPTEEPEQAEIIAFPLLPRRRAGAVLILAAAVAVAAFGGGYLFGHSKAKPSAFATQRIVPMHAAGTGLASPVALVKVAQPDANGNTALDFQVTGLAKQPTGSYYELWLTRKGKPWASCGTFRVEGRTTTVRFSVPYRLSRYSGWVVTGVTPGRADPGETVMTT